MGVSLTREKEAAAMKRHATLTMMVVMGLGLLLRLLVAGSPPSPISLAAPAATTRYAPVGGCR